jgi:hypothetical protein
VSPSRARSSLRSPPEEGGQRVARMTEPQAEVGQERLRLLGRPPTTRVDASSSCPSREDAAACLVGRSPNRHREITTDLKRPSFCGGYARSAADLGGRELGAGALLLER